MAKQQAKAANGLGSVFQLANGRWRAHVTGLDGKPKTRTVGTQNLARKALQELIRERDTLAAGGVVASASLTVADVLDAWLTVDLPTRRRAPATVYAYEAAAANLKREIGGLKIAKLRVRELDSAFVKMARGGATARATLVKAKQVLAQAFDFAIKREDMARNLARSITIPAVARDAKVSRSLDVEQARKLLAAVRGHRWEALFVIALNLGLRPGELSALCWDHVDLDRGTISVGRGIRRARNGRPELSDEVKTARARRTIKLPAMALASLAAHKARQLETDLSSGVRSDLVFRTSVGTIILPRNLARELAKITTALGLGDKWTPNEMRHTAASLLVDQGVPLVIVADILGHTTTRMLEQTYRKNLRPEIDGAVAAMARVFGEVASA